MSADATELDPIDPTQVGSETIALPPGSPSTWQDLDPFTTMLHVPGQAKTDDLVTLSGRSESPILGSIFGNYELLHELGRGGMGVVYKARQRNLDRLVAIKMILGGHLTDTQNILRFQVEARAAAKLNDPHVVAIHDVGEIHGQHYFAMEYIDGPNLGELIRDRKITIDQAVRVAATVARAVHRLHLRGIIHRDLKPSNILLDSTNRPFVTDFGLVKLMEDSSGATCTGTILGTPSYMAPEQATGDAVKVGPKSDVYSLGAILYEMLTGRPPFREASAMETLSLVLSRDPTPPRQVNSTVSTVLELICLKCLEKAPGDRYASADLLADDLERYLHGDDVEAHPAGWWLRVRRWARREPALASRVGGLSLCLVVSQVNYQIMHPATLWTHVKVMGLLGLWMFLSYVYQRMLRRGRRADTIHAIWAATDLAALTGVLIVDDAMIGPLICGYPLLVAASGLWFRVPLVWATTALAELFYGLLILAALKRDGFVTHPAHHFMCMVTLGVLGIVIVTLVKRIRILTQNHAGPPAAGSASR